MHQKLSLADQVVITFLAYLLGGDYVQTKKEMANSKFLSRFDTLLPKYGIKLPSDMFHRLKQAYFTRNTVIHGLQAVNIEDAANYVNTAQEILVWYWENVGAGASSVKAQDEDIPSSAIAALVGCINRM